ncbi:hypothetical protein EYR40_010513 [Pleurotus pulmonarius]|nr:hypothetical protein EYR36_010098 [Pleurotus pulmonarius]KAF4586513.1 hypothetical protein EYR38_010792 [Pleurotus pulmonarius]KAF4588957.1 hypothetical protein EYR40_010513 [Pleurotus pulmonarius]
MTSQGRVRQLIVTNDGTFDGTVYVFKNAGTYYLAGSITVGETRSLDLTQVKGINNGDDIRVRILSSQGADNTDSTLVTYVSNAANGSRYLISGTAGDPKIAFQNLAPLQ